MKIEVQVGQAVKKDDVLLVVEAMKMETPMRSAQDGVVKAIHVAVGQAVPTGKKLVTI